MLNGANPFGIPGSVNFPGKSGVLVLPLSTSIVPLRKFAERRYASPPMISSVAPL